MQAKQNSFFYHIYCIVRQWLSSQWESSMVIHWLTHQRNVTGPFMGRWVQWCHARCSTDCVCQSFWREAFFCSHYCLSLWR